MDEIGGEGKKSGNENQVGEVETIKEGGKAPVMVQRKRGGRSSGYRNENGRRVCWGLRTQLETW